MTANGTLQGCNAVITGASRGLGRSIAEAFWREGANLLLVARSTALLQQVAQGLPSHTDQKVHVCSTDLSSDSAPGQIMAAAHASFDRLDILINNAATQVPIGLLEDCDWEAWQRALRVNLLAPVALCRAVLPWMIKQRRGKIINISGGGATSPRARFSAYATAKAGLVRFSETLAGETCGKGIAVNCIAPGAMGTDMLKLILEAGPEKAGVKEYELAQKAIAAGEAVLHRAAALAVFLASAASDGITGRLISAQWDPWPQLPSHTEDLQRSDIYTLRRIVPRDRGMNWD